MSRPKAKKAARTVPEPAVKATTITKADAMRAALAEGIEAPGDAVDFIKKRFGLDITPQHFSANKSLERRKAGKAAPDHPALPPPPPSPAAGDVPELLAAMGAIKPLIAQYGAAQIRQIIDLLE